MANTFQGLHARHYDLIYAEKPYADESRFVHDLLGGEPGRLLDVACGSGRHAREFAKLGWEVSGVDYSAELLEHAAATGIEVHEQDMRRLDLPGELFDGVTSLFDSIGYPQEDEGVVAALAGMRRHLAPGGRVAVEFLHAPALLANADPVRVRRFELPDGGTLVRISETELRDSVMHVSYEVIELRPDGSYERETERQSNRFFAVEEMRALMELAGLRVERFVPAYGEGEIGPDTFHVIGLAEAAVKVAVVYYQLTPEGGGVHTFTQSIHAALRDAERASRHEFVYYATATDEGPPPGVTMLPAGKIAAAQKRTILRLREAQDRLGAPRIGPGTWFERSLAERDVDLVWFATNYAEDCEQPFIFTVFDVEHARQPWFPEVSANGQWEQRHHYFSRYIPKATRVIVPNEAGRDQVERYWRIEADRFLLLHHPTPEFALQAGDQPAPPRDALDRRGIGERYLFYPAQFWAHKNHATIFEALGLLGGEYELVCVGSDKGQLDHHRRLAATLGVAERVHFLGFVPTDDLVALYRHAHALTYASLFGPENLPPLEAMALGCPVVAADVPGAREQLGDAALRVPALDAAALANAVRTLDDPSERDRLVAAGRERAARFTAEGYVGGVLAFLDDFERVRRTWA